MDPAVVVPILTEKIAQSKRKGAATQATTYTYAPMHTHADTWRHPP